MDDLVRWLGEQLDEDARIARTAIDAVGPILGAGQWRYAESLADEGGRYWSITTVAPNETVPTVELVGSGMSGGGVHEEALARHIVEHDPARVLREIDAKRRILALHRPVQRRSTGSGGGTVEDCQICGHFPAQYPCGTLRALALPYADRPGYRAEWAPAE
ncbi:DUF6221 family protein [Streptomyces sp. NPDC002838]|uniref:DUF6221 family protein n=1 Tax=Streptomyces sp. NPDC002838 TaxID=3154436 RepID=UPI00331E188B